MKNFKKIMGLTVILMIVLFALPQAVLADDGGQGDQSGAAIAERTIMLYLCGSDLEGSYGMGTHNLEQILSSSFSAEGKVRLIVLTGGSKYWGLDSDHLYGTDPIYDEPVTQISKRYNQLWEAKGIDAEEHPGQMVLIDGNGITGADGENVRSEDELMSDPETLKKFIDLAAAYAPAKKYDLILWDHGDGPVGGYGCDSHTKDYDEDNYPAAMSFPDMIDAISDNAVIRDENAGKFDFISFDACLMSNVEIILALSGYTDYFIGSAETEPGFGQDYRGWLDAAGREPALSGFELGKIIVNDFIAYYDEEDSPGYGQEGTLAVIDMNRLVEDGFVTSLNDLNGILQSQVRTANDDGDLLYYDEIRSVERSISYLGNRDTYRDFGNLIGQIGISLKEINAANIDNKNIFNEYKEASQNIIRILGDESVMYARGTKGIVKDAQITMTEGGSIQYKDLHTSGMQIFFPTLKDTKDTRRHFDLVESLAESGKIKNEDCRAFLQQYPYTTLYYALLVESGKAVSALIDQGTKKQEIDFAKVKDYWEKTMVPILDKWGQPSGQEISVWDQTAGPLITRLSAVTPAEDWLDDLIRQQAGDAVSVDNVSAEKRTSRVGCRVRIGETDKRIIERAETQLVTEYPAAVEEIKNSYYASYFGEGGLDYKFCVASVPAEEDYSELDLDETAPLEEQFRAYLKWYAKNESSWDLKQSVEEVYALQDADGGLHAVSAEFRINGKAIVPFQYWGSDDNDPERFYQKNGTLIFESSGNNEYVLSQVYLTIGYGSRPILASELKGNLPRAKTTYTVHLPDVTAHFTITKTEFTISKENAGSIRLVRAKVSEMDDIADADGDGKKDISEKYVISDMYHHEYDITDIVREARTIREITPLVVLSPSSYIYDGKVKTPGVTVKDGETVLKEGTDYTVSYGTGRRNAGKYKVTVTLKGNYSGTGSGTFTIGKAANKLKVKGKKVRVKGVSKGKLKRTRTLKVSQVIAFRNKGQGKMAYVKKKGSKKITINRKTGKVTVKKGLKKGTYKVKVKVRAAGNSNYKASSWKTVTFKVVIK